MNEQQSRQLGVIKFCLKFVYPKYNVNIFLVYLAMKSRISWLRKVSGEKMNYKLKTIPQYEANNLLKNTLGDYLPVVVDKCVIISKERFVQLCTENLYYLDNGVLWVAMKLSRESRIKYKVKSVPPTFQLSSRNNLNTLTSDNRKLLRTDTNSDSIDNMRIVPVVGSDAIPEGEAATSENEFYNVTTTFGLKDKDFEVTFHPIPSLEYEPKMATSAEVCLILDEHVWPMEFLKGILGNYFESPKTLSVNDVFSIQLRQEITAEYNFLLQECDFFFTTSDRVYFKCTSITIDKKIEDESVKIVSDSKTKENQNVFSTFFIAKGETQMSMSDSVNMLKPKDEFLTLRGDTRNTVQQCPTGLREKFDQIQESILPFLNGDINKISSTLSSPIMPLLLLTGSDGTGRERLVESLAKYNGMSCLEMECITLRISTAKQAESEIESTIQKAKRAAPCIVMLNQFEDFGLDPVNNEDSRIIEYFKNSLLDLYQNYTEHQIIFIAISKSQDLKPNILRLFLEKFHLSTLNTQQRYETLEWFTKALQLKIDGVALSKEIKELCPSTKELLRKVAAKTETFTHGDIDLLMNFVVRESYFKQESNYGKYLKDPDVSVVMKEDFDLGLESLRRFRSPLKDAPKIPKVYWKDIGGLDNLKKELIKTIEFPIKYPHLFKNPSLRRSGLLLYGPPGCGKTLVAKAVSTELNVSFISVKGPELLNMYIGQSEENVRKVFESARAASPCIVFLDELDALAPRRGAAGDAGGASDRLVGQLLAELDGVTTGDEADRFVFVMGATNRPDLLEQSLLRPGRLDKRVYVGPYCGAEEKTSVLTALCRKQRLHDEVDLSAVAAALPERCTGADLMQVVETARASAVRSLVAKLHKGLLKESELSPDLVILGVSELWEGVESFRPSITDEELANYESLETQL